MLIIATFKHSAYLELALILIEQKGISKEYMIVAPLDKQHHNDNEIDLILVHQDGKTQMDKVFIFGTIFMLLGAIYGFVLVLGPIIWALIGLVVGGVVGLIFDYFIRKKPQNRASSDESEVVLMVQCDTHQTETIERILWNHQALGVSKINGYSGAPQ
jgi:hypothetical protein